MKPTMLSVKEVALELGVIVQSIRRAYWKGEIPAYRISTMLRFDLERVQQIFLAKGLSPIVRPRAARPPVRAGGALRKKPPFGKTGARIAQG
ncbi:MAG: helix-turn-helix domain-containing protein [Nitrospirales bacterium]